MGSILYIDGEWVGVGWRVGVGVSRVLVGRHYYELLVLLASRQSDNPSISMTAVTGTIRLTATPSLPQMTQLHSSTLANTDSTTSQIHFKDQSLPDVAIPALSRSLQARAVPVAQQMSPTATTDTGHPRQA